MTEAKVESESIACLLCSRTFTRAEHLERHRRSSHDLNIMKSFQCHICSKSFTRKDVLTRHVRAVHEAPSLPRRSKKKSCVRCANFKIKCSGGEICQACMKRNLKCAYDLRKISSAVTGGRGWQNKHEDLNYSEYNQNSDRKELSATVLDSKSPDSCNVEPRPCLHQSPELVHPIFVPSPSLLSSLPLPSPSPSLRSLPLSGGVQIEQLNHELPSEDSSTRNTEVFPLPNIPAPIDPLVTSWVPSPLNNLVSENNFERWLFDPEAFDLNWLRADLGVTALVGNDLKVPASSATTERPNSLPTPPTSISQHNPLNRALRYDTIQQPQSMLSSSPSFSQNPDSPGPDVPSPRSKTMPAGQNSRPPLANLAWHFARTDSPKTSNPALKLPPPMPFSSLVTRRAQEDRNHAEIFPWSPRIEEEQLVKLPPMRRVLEQANYSTLSSTSSANPTEGIDDLSRKSIIDFLSLPHDRPPFPEVDMGKFPDCKTLDSFLHLYFQNFHPVLPMIHRPTFRASTCPAILLATMVSIGASYSEIEGSNLFADSMSELCKRLITWMIQYDVTYMRSGYFVTAYCLQNIYALGSGNTKLYEEADASRSYLVANARWTGLFTQPRLNQFTITGEETDDELEKIWHAWRDEETGKRLAWSVFEYDCAISMLSNRRGNLALHDVNIYIPCEEKLWEAVSARQWKSYAFKPGENVLKCGLPFFAALRTVIDQTLLLHTVPNWGKRLFTQAIGRILWDIRELEDSALSQVLPDNPVDYSSTKNALLLTLTALQDSVTDPYNILDMVHMNMTCLIAHYSHLYSARETMDLAIALAKTQREDRLDAMHRIQVIFTLDPVNARKLAWHAAQIVGIARRYAIRTPCETMRVFLAGLFLYAFAKYFPADNSNNNEDDNYNGDGQDPVTTVNLDTLPWLSGVSWDERQAELDRYFMIGGNAKMDSVDLLCSADGKGAEQVLAVVLATLKLMKCWGLAQKFSSVLIYVHHRDLI
ncbi:fungal-specific transcription factor domain-containing protein, partial [Lipomyces japonicus]|uniref:fungal-specific transcription factor domain-containing protein n=1 Tax=Lipomyces japonicus TaxID=56871 RepID=UPI0034CE7CB3